MTSIFTDVESPIGRIRIVAAGAVICRVDMDTHAGFATRAAGDRGLTPLLRLAARQLREYLDGARFDFELPLRASGTAFQQRAWQALRAIPFGETRSYAEQARAIGRPTATRAVGAANARNPIAIIVPCHRVIGSDGSLTGYAGGEAAKRWLLAHEARARAGDVSPRETPADKRRPRASLR